MIAPHDTTLERGNNNTSIDINSNSCRKEKPPVPPRRLLVRKSKSPQITRSPSAKSEQKAKSISTQQLPIFNQWSSSHESLISFHFSLLPFFESKDESDNWLMYQSDSYNDHIKWPVYQKSQAEKDEKIRLKEQHEKQRFSSLDAMFVKAIFPFIERRIEEEGIWRKSGNFNRIKKLQKELQSIIATPEKLRQPKAPARRRSSLSRAGNSKSSIKNNVPENSFVGSVKSARSFDSLCSNTSLDDIDDEDNTYSVHDMTLLVKRILIPVFQKSNDTIGFFKLVDHLSLKIPKEIVEVSIGRDQRIRDSDPRMYANFISCLSLFTLFHLKLRHSMYDTVKKSQPSDQSTPQITKGSKSNLSPNLSEEISDPSAMSLLCSLFDLLSKTATHSVSNKMIPSSLATLFLPLFYPSTLSMTAVSSSSDRLLVDTEQDIINKRLTAMLSFIINYWPQITSATSLPNTFMTDFKLLQQSSNKGTKRKSGAAESEDSVMSTCVRFAQPSTSGANSTIDETQIELARMYAHVQATQDKKMIKKLNRAGIIIHSKKNSKNVLIPSNDLNTPPSSAASPNECPRTEPKKLKGLKALLAGSPFVRSTAKKRRDRKINQGSPSSYDFSTDNSFG